MLRRLAGALLSSGVGSALSWAAGEYRSQKRIEVAKTKSEKFASETVTTRVIQRAFADAGYQGKVVVEYQYNYPPKTTTTTSMIKHESRVVVTYAHPHQLDNIKLTYAVAGHEAVHAMHQHGAQYAGMMGAMLGFQYYYNADYLLKLASKNASTAKLGFVGLALLAANFAATTMVSKHYSRQCETQADLRSTRKLGTGRALIASFEKEKQDAVFHVTQKEKGIGDLLHSHPSHNVRIQAIKNDAQQPADCRFFATKEFKTLEADMRVAQQSAKDDVKRMYPR